MNMKLIVGLLQKQSWTTTICVSGKVSNIILIYQVVSAIHFSSEKEDTEAKVENVFLCLIQISLTHTTWNSAILYNSEVSQTSQCEENTTNLFQF